MIISDIITLALCETDARGFAQIAQLVEQRTENPRVAGSIPAGTTIRMMQVYPSPAEGIGLENRQRINVLRGFESLNLRH